VVVAREVIPLIGRPLNVPFISIKAYNAAWLITMPYRSVYSSAARSKEQEHRFELVGALSSQALSVAPLNFATGISILSHH
jgi:hypothetical protein